MKNLLLLPLLLFFLVSCQKDELNTEIPEWLQPRIEELDKSSNCFDCELTRYTFNDEFYYHIYCGYWSCLYCELYNKNGNLVEWGVTDFNDFMSEKKDELVIWSCSEKD